MRAWTLHHESDGEHARHGPLVARDSLDASLLDAMAAGEALELGVEAVAVAELVLPDDVFLDDFDGGDWGGGGDWWPLLGLHLSCCGKVRLGCSKERRRR